MSAVNPERIRWWLELIRAIIAAAAGIFGGMAMNS